jgi:hypothetical protein
MIKPPTDKQIEAALRAWFKLEPREPLDFTSNQEREAMYRDMEATLIAAADTELTGSNK